MARMVKVIRHMARSLVLLLLGLAACADEVATQAPPASPESTVVMQNIAYTTNVYPTTTSTPTPTMTAATSTPTATIPPTFELPPRPQVQRDLVPVGVASCDRYLVRVESCSSKMLSKTSSQDATERLTSSLDLTRRSWRRAITQGGSTMRANLEESCADMLKYYESTASQWCAN